MNAYCSVPKCKSWRKKNTELSFHVFPKKGKSKVKVSDYSGSEKVVLVDRRQMWMRNLRIEKEISDYMKVCSLHFDDNDFLQKQRNKRRTLKFYAVPTKNLPSLPSKDSPVHPNSSKRTRRSKINISPSVPQNNSTSQCSSNAGIVKKKFVYCLIDEKAPNVQEDIRKAAESLLSFTHANKKQNPNSSQKLFEIAK